MNVRDAAIEVLRDAVGPLHVQEIAKRILVKGLWQTQGKTPVATVSARLYSDIQRHQDASPFVLVGSQTFRLRELGTGPAPQTSPPATLTIGQPVKLVDSATTYSFTEAAEKVLEEFGEKRPMHYRAITEKALAMGWLSTEGKTPEATMYAQILTEIRRRQKRSHLPRFVQHGRGYVGLSRWTRTGLPFEIDQHNKGVRQALHERLLSMDPTEFEELVARLLVEVGFEDVEVTRRSGDGGIDVRGTLVVGEVIRIGMAVQVKRWKPKSNVQAPIVQQVRGSLGTHDQGLIITTSDFSHGARKEAERADAIPVALMNGEQLVALLAENSIGVTRQSYDLIELGEQDSLGSQ